MERVCPAGLPVTASLTKEAGVCYQVTGFLLTGFRKASLTGVLGSSDLTGAESFRLTTLFQRRSFCLTLLGSSSSVFCRFVGSLWETHLSWEF